MKPYDSTADTEAHIAQVAENMRLLAHMLVLRAESHDSSKLADPEKAVFDEVTPKLRGLTYGSAEYKASLAEMGEALRHHYAHNRHHPEHFADGMKGMTFVDLIEMFCDWCAATQRHEDGNIGKSIDTNMKRFGFGEVLASIMVGTAQAFRMGAKHHDAYRPTTKETQ